jgi:predicted aspartyl protease
MRLLTGVLLCGCLLGGDVSELLHLEETGRIFELRRALEQSNSDGTPISFFRAVVAGRLGHEAEAVAELRQFLATHPNTQLQRWAYQEMASDLERLGRYAEAAQAWAEALPLIPRDDYDRADTENTEALDDAIRDVPPETVEPGEASIVQARHNGVGSWDVPVEVNGQQGQWIFDTGANISTIAESEAAKMKLSIRDTSTYVRGSTGAKNSLRIAVAHDLIFGSTRVHNVVMLVLSDNLLYIGPLKYQIRGILGLPVIRALESVEVSSKGAIRIRTNTPVPSGEPNMFFEELSPIVEVSHNNRATQMFLDTGANTTLLYPSFRPVLAQNEIRSLKKKRDQTAGVGQAVKRKAEVMPILQLQVFGRALDITKVTLISEQPKGQAGRRDGVIGMDALNGGFTLDFRDMQFEVQ